jgi:hypothetical protein
LKLACRGDAAVDKTPLSEFEKRGVNGGGAIGASLTAGASDAERCFLRSNEQISHHEIGAKNKKTCSYERFLGAGMVRQRETARSMGAAPENIFQSTAREEKPSCFDRDSLAGVFVG